MSHRAASASPAAPGAGRTRSPARRSFRIASSGRAAWWNGVGGWVDDDLAIVRPWGFDLERVSAPVLVWHGAGDVLVPRAHGDWLARNARWLSAGVLPEDALAPSAG